MHIVSRVSLSALLVAVAASVAAAPSETRPHRSNHVEGELREGFVRGTEHKMHYRVINGRAMIDDMVVGDEQSVRENGIRNIFKRQTTVYNATVSLPGPGGSNNGVTAGAVIWPSNTLYYTIDSSLSTKARQAVTDGLNLISSRTSVKFVARTSQANYVRYYAGDGCWSGVGMAGGKQDLSIGTGCEYPEIVAHETMHALGWYHEQSRADRDTYLTINLANVTSGMEYNFDKVPASVAEPYGAFDFASVMIYDAYAFSKNGKATMVPKSSSVGIDSFGFSTVLSSGDVASINHFYPASSSSSSKASSSSSSKASSSASSTASSSSSSKSSSSSSKASSSSSSAGGAPVLTGTGDYPTGFSKCSDEGATCSVSKGTGWVAFGRKGKWVAKNVGVGKSIACTVAAFGSDPGGSPNKCSYQQ